MEIKTFTLEEAAAFLKLHPEEVRRRAKVRGAAGGENGKAGCFSTPTLPSMCARSMLSLGKRCEWLRERRLKHPGAEDGRSRGAAHHRMPLYKRSGTRWIDVTTPVGERIRRSAGTADRARAQELHDKLKAESWRVHRLGEKPSHTWDEAGYKVLIETQHKATHQQDKGKLRWLQQFLRGKPLAEIDRELIGCIAEAKAKQSTPANANRMLALIRAILRKAALEWEWIDKVPKIRLYKEANRRVRWLRPVEVQRLLEELPQHQRDLVIFALSTGLRQSNVVKLEWSQVDMARCVAWIHPD